MSDRWDHDAWLQDLMRDAARCKDWAAARRWLLFTRGYYRAADGRLKRERDIPTAEMVRPAEAIRQLARAEREAHKPSMMYSEPGWFEQ